MNCARPGLWEGRVGNHRLYPAADGPHDRLLSHAGGGGVWPAAHRGRSASVEVVYRDQLDAHASQRGKVSVSGASGSKTHLRLPHGPYSLPSPLMLRAFLVLARL